jgi:hypothetical protein
MSGGPSPEQNVVQLTTAPKKPSIVVLLRTWTVSSVALPKLNSAPAPSCGLLLPLRLERRTFTVPKLKMPIGPVLLSMLLSSTLSTANTGAKETVSMAEPQQSVAVLLMT